MEGNTLYFYLQLMWQTNGLVCIFAAMELIRGILTKNRGVLLIAIFPLIYFPFISSFVVRNDRTFLPLTPFIFLLASSFLYSIFRRIHQLQLSKKRSFSLVLFCLLIALALSIPTYKTIVNSIRNFNVEDARETSRKWIINNVPKGAKIAFESYTPFLDEDGFDIHAFYQITENPPDWYIKNNFHYLILSSGSFGRFLENLTFTLPKSTNTINFSLNSTK